MPVALVVDRDPSARQAYATLLRETACEIEEAEDGRDALAMALSRQHVLILTESRLPGMSGLELCRVLRADELTRTTPIVVLAENGAADVRLAVAAGADAVFEKPCPPEQLAAEIARLIAASQRAREHSSELRRQAVMARAKSRELLEGPDVSQCRVKLNRAYQRGATSEPPLPPPSPVCQSCDRALKYVKSQIGGVSERHAEQWDRFECPGCKAVFEYRHRTRRLRRCDPAR